MIVTSGFSDDERPRIAHLYWQAFGGKLGRVLGPEPKALALLTRSLDPAFAICARDHGGQVVGIAGYRTHLGALTRDDRTDLVAVYGPIGGRVRSYAMALLSHSTSAGIVVDGIAVAPEARNRGIGAALVEALANEARTLGYDAIELEVAEQNNRARALYERLGFVAVSTEKAGWAAPLFGFRASTRMVRRLVP